MPKMKKTVVYCMPTVLKDVNLLYTYCIYATYYKMGCSLNLRLDFGSFLSQFVKKYDFCQNKRKKQGPKIMIFVKNKEKNRGLLYAFAIKS